MATGRGPPCPAQSVRGEKGKLRHERTRGLVQVTQQPLWTLALTAKGSGEICPPCFLLVPR